MKFLVTGCAGFIGSSIVAELLSDASNEVVGIDSFTDYYEPAMKRENVANFIEHKNFDLLDCDLLAADLNAILRNVDVVFHQAGQPGVRGSWGQEFELYTDRNVLATQRLLEACRQHNNLQKFVYASSSSVYGEATSYPTKESDSTRPFSPYGVTKLAGEHLAVLYGRNFGVPTVCLRYFTVYGPRQRPDMLFSRIVKSSFGEWNLELFGTGEQVRDFTYVADIVEANISAALGPTEAGTVFNVSGGSNVSVNDVLRILGEVTGEPIKVARIDTVPGDVRRTGGDSSAIAESLGWRPRVDIREGLSRMYSFEANRRG